MKVVQRFKKKLAKTRYADVFKNRKQKTRYGEGILWLKSKKPIANHKYLP